MTNRKFRLAAYFRTSSNGQEREETIRRQFDNFARAWESLAEIYELVPRYPGAAFTDMARYHFVDDGYNLEEWDECTAFHDLMSRCKRREIDAIWISESDRLVRARSHEVRGRTLDFIQRFDIKILTKNGEVPSGILLSLLSSIGAEDKRAIMLKCQEGKITRAERDGHPPSGKIPFGFKFTKRNSKWEIIEDEARLIRSAVSLMIGKVLPEIPPGVAALAQLNPGGLPDPKIVETLNASGFSLVNYYERNGFTRWLAKNPTGAIRPGFMNNLIQDDRYRGRYVIYLRDPRQVGHPDFLGMDRENKRKIVLSVPPILTDEVWTELHQKRKSRQVKSKRNVRHDYLIKDLLVCDHCGVTMSARPKWGRKKDGSDRNTAPTLYYVCWRKLKANGQRCDATRCHSVPKLDGLVFNYIKEVLLRPETLGILNSKATEVIPSPSLPEHEWSLAEQEKRVLGIKEERKRAVTNLNRGLISVEDFEGERIRIESEMKACEKLIGALQRKLQAIRKSLEKTPAVDLSKIREQILPRLETLSFEERRQTVLTLLNQVRIRPNGEIKIFLRPIKMNEVQSNRTVNNKT